jgi:hypothetical protein
MEVIERKTVNLIYGFHSSFSCVMPNFIAKFVTEYRVCVCVCVSVVSKNLSSLQLFLIFIKI